MPHLLLLVSCPVSAATWIVDPSGGGDATSITAGLALMSDGDTLEIRAGTYYEDQLRTPDSVTIRGEGWESTIVDTGGSWGFSLGDSSVVEDLSVKGATFGLWTTAGSALSRCAFIDGDVGIEVDQSVEVYDSYFFGNADAGIEPYYVPGSIRVENSVFAGNEWAMGSPWLGDYVSRDPTYEFHHNTFVGGQGGIIVNDDSLYSFDLTITNNLFSDQEYAVYVGTEALGEISYNLVGTDVTYGLEILSSSITQTDNVTADPVFVAWSDDGDWTNDDFRLVGGSPGIDMGAEGYALSTTDLDGTTRPVDGDGDGTATPDAGAYEYDPALDVDGDGYTTLDDADCDDTDASVSPAATETWYDGIDQDCDGADDDQDADGYALADDCDDTDASVNPAATETWYDGMDQDCDGADDDQDGDGFAVADDCDDTDATVSPAAPETWYDGVDQDCDGADDDQDGDGFALADDCDDTDATVSPAATEVCGDGLDQDCDTVDPDCPDTGPADDTAADDTGSGSETGESAGTGEPGCEGCASGSGSTAGLVSALLLATRRRR